MQLQEREVLQLQVSPAFCLMGDKVIEELNIWARIGRWETKAGGIQPEWMKLELK